VRARRPSTTRTIARNAALALGLALLAGTAGARDRGADGRFEKRSSAHFVLWQDVDIDESGGFHGSRRFEQELLGELEGAYERLDALLGLRPTRPIEVVVYDPRVFDATFAGRFRFPAAGFYQGVVRVRGDVGVTAQLAQVLHHELVHAALHQASPSFVWPGWFNEGMAQWFEARVAGQRHLGSGAAAALARVRDTGQWIPLDSLWVPSFARFGPDAAELAYLESYGIVAHVASRFGERVLRDLCAEVVRTLDVERALRRSTRMGSAELEASFLGAQ
jgi:hypothetical protein